MEKYSELTKSPEENVFLDKRKDSGPLIKATKRRWVILFLFMYYACINCFQWIALCSITPLVVKYYNVSTVAVDWTSVIYMAIYPVLIIPSSYITDKMGLRVAGIIGCTLTLIGTAVKLLSIQSDLFVIVLVGQAFLSIAQIFIVSVPPKVASVWFKANELSTVCSLGVFGSQLGSAIGYVVPPLIVRDSQNLDDIGDGLRLMCWALTLAMIPVTFGVYFFFPKEPKFPPSVAQAKIRKSKMKFETKAFFIALKSLFTNKGFIIHMAAYGINIAVFSAVGTLFTQFVLQYFPGAAEDAGRMGCVLVVAGMIGSVILGIILDRNHKYKETSVVLYFLAAVSIAGIICAFEWHSMLWSYILSGALGFFTTAYMVVGFELGIELTFPLDESTVSGISLAVSQVLGVVVTVLLGQLNLAVGCFWALISQIILLLLGTVITACVPNKLKRQDALRN